MVVPLSTVPNWIKEFSRWMPQMNVIVYVGDSKSREVARAFEFQSQYASAAAFKFEVLITTYELVLKDAPILSRIRWQYLMVDEAHRCAPPPLAPLPILFFLLLQLQPNSGLFEAGDRVVVV